MRNLHPKEDNLYSANAVNISIAFHATSTIIQAIRLLLNWYALIAVDLFLNLVSISFHVEFSMRGKGDGIKKPYGIEKQDSFQAHKRMQRNIY